jgi:hypothetical protein
MGKVRRVVLYAPLAIGANWASRFKMLYSDIARCASAAKEWQGLTYRNAWVFSVRRVTLFSPIFGRSGIWFALYNAGRPKVREN